MKKVAILTLYWPPDGGTNVLRWVKFAKHLPKNGWKPIIITPYRHSFHSPDQTLLSETSDEIDIIRFQLPDEYYQLFYNEVPVTEVPEQLKTKSLLERILQVFTKEHEVQKTEVELHIDEVISEIVKRLKEEKIHSFVSAGMVESIHLFAKKIANNLRCHWLLDVKNPFGVSFDGDAGYSTTLRFSKKLLENGKALIVPGKRVAYELNQQGLVNTEVITDGFDDVPRVPETDKKFTIVHIGTMNDNRIPGHLWQALDELCNELNGFKKDLRIELIGDVSDTVIQNIESYALKSNVNYIKRIPNIDARLRAYKAQVLLLVIERLPEATSIITHKFYEYLAACRPILGIGPLTGDAAEILHDTGAGRMFHYKELRELKNQITFWYNEYNKRELVVKSKGIRKYNCRTLSKQLASFLENPVVRNADALMEEY